MRTSKVRQSDLVLLCVWIGILGTNHRAAGQSACGDGTCTTPPENSCNCPNDCGAPPATESCGAGFPSNPMDDDCDGMIDCADDDCIFVSVPFIGSIPCFNCGNGVCAGCERCGTCAICPPECGPPVTAEINCADGMDNDCNGTADCADVQCLSLCCGNGRCDPTENHCNCPSDCGTAPGSEINCADGRDNDCDGGMDCADSECFSLPICCGNATCSPWENPCNCPGDCGPPAGAETICDDLLDDDCDGLTDCAELTCVGQPTVCGDNVCTSPPENKCNCPNDCGAPLATESCGSFPGGLIDDDCNGMIDCNDDHCISVSVPLFGSTPCGSCGDGRCAGCERCGGCASCSLDCGPPVTSETNCADGQDNDCNGMADCADPQCLSVCCGNGTCDPAENSCNCHVDCGCRTGSEINCVDGRDNDCDGLTDCSDPECQGGTETNCTDGLDDDCNGTTDCADTACCSNSTDCFGDCLCCGLGGCDSLETPCSCPADCGSYSTNETPGSTCQDGIDNDCDGRADCYDPDCYDADGDGFDAPPCGRDCDDANASIHPGATEVCNDAIDNDCDSLVDCADSHCFSDAACCGDGNCDVNEWCTCPADCGTQTSEAGFCFDFADNDCDGLPNCQDRDCCATESACRLPFPSQGCGDASCRSDQGENSCSCQCDCGAPPATETACTDNADNDCDSLIDCRDPDCYGPDADGDGVRADLCELDCDDTNATVYPGAAEICNDGVDNDCDARIDCGDYADCTGDPACCDGDGTCESFESKCTCAADCGTPPSSENGVCADGLDNDCDGVADCDDFECCQSQPSCQLPFGCGDGSCHSVIGETQCTCQCDCGPPGSVEGSCGNTRDDDCDGLTDCADPDCQNRDLDGDGSAGAPCGTDCDDSNATISPLLNESCADGTDNNCDGWTDCVDPDCIGDSACAARCASDPIFGNFLGCFMQASGGGGGSGTACDNPVACCMYFSNPFGPGSWGCREVPAICCGGGYGPGSTCVALPLVEVICNDGVDDDCDGLRDCFDPDCRFDGDGDGFDAVPCGSDCADADPCAIAGPAENCADGMDNDCDLAIDCADTDCQSDADTDGFIAQPCGSDCDDNNASANPSAVELCADGVDNDCDSATDCADANCATSPACCPSSSSAQPTMLSNGSGTLVARVNNRVLSFTAGDAGRTQAVRVTLRNLTGPFSSWNGRRLFVGNLSDVCEVAGVGPGGTCPSGAPTEKWAKLQCTMHCRTDWSQMPVINAFHEGVVPGGIYDLEVIDCSCDPNDPNAYSAALTLNNPPWGDLCGILRLGIWTASDGGVGVTTDVVADLEKFSNRLSAPRKSRADLEPGCLDRQLNISDVSQALNGFRSIPYPFIPTAMDPCQSQCP